MSRLHCPECQMPTIEVRNESATLDEALCNDCYEKQEEEQPMTQHTPGPWTTAINTARHKFAWEVTGAEGLVPTIARLGLVDQGPKVVEANARLIAASPDLLLQLKLLVRWAEDQGEDCLFAKAAIAKAEGRA